MTTPITDKPMQTPISWDTRYLKAADGEVIGRTYMRDRGYFIIRAVNSHDALVEALARLVAANAHDSYEAGMTYASFETECAVKTARAALALANEVK
jgi:hypothetical protein